MKKINSLPATLNLFECGFAPILILVIVLALGVVGFVSYKFGVNIISVTATPTQTVLNLPTASASPTLDPNINWKTYSGNGITFRYPANWTMDINNKGHISFDLRYFDKTQNKVTLPGGSEEYPEYFIAIYLPPNDEWDTGAKTEKITVAGMDAYKYKTGAAPSSGMQTMVGLSTGNGYYYFEYGAMVHEETHEKYMYIFDQILSTFKFTNAKKDFSKLKVDCNNLMGNPYAWNVQTNSCDNVTEKRTELQTFCSENGGEFVDRAVAACSFN